MKIDLASLKGSAILDLAKEGHTLLCPVCGNQLVTIPEQLPLGARPLGVACPMSQRHYIFYAEPADRVQNVRKGIALIVAQTIKKDT